MTEPLTAQTLLEQQADARRNTIKEKQSALDNHMTEARSLQAEIDRLEQESVNFDQAALLLKDAFRG